MRVSAQGNSKGPYMEEQRAAGGSLQTNNEILSSASRRSTVLLDASQGDSFCTCDL